ncbi:S41 family peptidase, partial [bacterium]|nr:S41 family peptidase [bacterium]
RGRAPFPACGAPAPAPHTPEMAPGRGAGDDDTDADKDEPRAAISAEDSMLAPDQAARARVLATHTTEEEPIAGPLTVAVSENEITLSCEGKSKVVRVPESRAGAVSALMSGYAFAVGCAHPDEPRRLLFDALSYMTFRLDPHSNFLPPVAYESLETETSGRFGGVGIEVGLRGDHLTVVAPIEGTPAGQAGLLPMDRIVAVDGKSTEGMSLTEAVNLIRGEIGSPVVLTIRRVHEDREEAFDVTLVRSTIPIDTIRVEMLENRVAIVRIFSFNVTTTADLEASLKALDEDPDGPPRALILDLRNNPGGLLNQAVSVADAFLESGMIVNTIGRGRLQEKESFATKANSRADTPLLVLVNSGSASGSEIVAGALQDHKRAVIVGTRTFGKGSVQSIFKLPEGTGLRLTTALYYTPSGRSIQAEGIVPDVQMRLPEVDEQLVSLYAESAWEGHLTSLAAKRDTADVELEAKVVREALLARGQIVEDPDYPEKGDWTLRFARMMLDGKDLTHDAIVERARKLYEQMS